MNYAPVLIPTLCRYNHLVNCLESLKKNNLAINTELFLALDYPSKENQMAGYDKICKYINNLSGFKKVSIIKRKANYGALFNKEDAEQKIFSKYDRLIFSEDDNIFSPNFLEFINKGLDKFADDQSVFAISGYKHFYNIKYADNNFFRQNVDFSAWGYGIWKDRWVDYIRNCNIEYFKSALNKPLLLIRILKNGSNRVRSFLLCTKESGITDNVLSVYMALEKKMVIMPTISKVRNFGWDGSGLHCHSEKELAERFLHQSIDETVSFEFTGEDWKYFNNNRKIYVRENISKEPWPILIIRLIYNILKFNFCGF